ncbi:MAG: PAS domain S-box protein [Candidatus Eisenbacteria sp.]|nr:PAS domain S-box protein [Candidatus Eisenbacteria bacterium]
MDAPCDTGASAGARAQLVLERRDELFRILYDTVMEATSADYDQVFSILCRNLRLLCGARSVMLASYEPHPPMLRIEAIDFQDELRHNCQESIGKIIADPPACLIGGCEATQIQVCDPELSSQIEEFFGCRTCSAACRDSIDRYRISCLRDGELLAIGMILLPSGWTLRQQDIINAYLNIGVVILHRNKAVRESSQSEKRFRTYVEQATVGILILIDDRVRYANPHLSDLMGCPAGDLDEPFYDFLFPEDRPHLDGYLKVLRSSHQSSPDLQIGFRHRTGHRIDIEISGTRVTYTGEPAELLFLRDVTERNTLQMQLSRAAKLEAIGQLAGGIAHEINTPTQYVGDNTRFLQETFSDMLELISTYQTLMERARARATTEEDFLKAKEAAEAIDIAFLEEEVPKALVQSLEGLGRISTIVAAMKAFANPQVCDTRQIDINKLIQDTVTVSRNEWKYVAEMETVLDDSIPCIPINAAAINQAILNIIINAAQAVAGTIENGSKEKGKISIRTRCEGNWILIEIQDTGGGIPKVVQPRVFDPFFTTKEVGSGTGQGLALAHAAVVDSHGGKLTFETKIGKGTTFVIRLPVAEADGNHAGSHGEEDTAA